MFSISVVIPTYNGQELLRENLPPLFEALARVDVPSEVIVVDDASGDGSVDFLRREFPSVIVLQNERNRGFAETINRGFSVAVHDIVLALNNDVTVEPDLMEKLLPRFQDQGVFAVSPNVLDPVTRQQQAIFKLRPGICWFRDTSLPHPPAAGGEIPLFFASGGSSCYHREKLMELGGFSTLFAPFYVEDVDLSYHAWKRGWRCVLEPAATVWHPANTTIGKYHRRKKVKYLTARNKHIFMWLNVTDPLLVIRYFACLVPSLLWDIVSFRKYKLLGMFMALPRLPDIMKERKARKRAFTVTDRAVMDQVTLQKD